MVCHPHPLYGGSMDNKVVHTIFRGFRDSGLQGLRFNFRGVGLSEGEYSEGLGEQQDLAAVVDWCATATEASAWTLAGFSFGSYVAAAAVSTLRQSALPACQRLVLVAPPVHHFDFAEIARFPCPVDVIQGTADEVVPLQEVTRWVDQRNDSGDDVSLHLLEGVSHFFHGALPELKETVLSVLKKAN